MNIMSSTVLSSSKNKHTQKHKGGDKREVGQGKNDGTRDQSGKTKDDIRLIK